MARLINDQGTWYLQINKDQPKELFALLSNLDGFYMETYKEEVNIFIFRISDYCQGDIPVISESEYRNILSKISENPDPDLIIPREPIVQEPPLSDEEYQELLKTKPCFELMNTPKVFSYLIGQYPKQADHKFMEQMGLNPNISNATFKWSDIDNNLVYPEELAKDLIIKNFKKRRNNK